MCPLHVATNPYFRAKALRATHGSLFVEKETFSGFATPVLMAEHTTCDQQNHGCANNADRRPPVELAGLYGRFSNGLSGGDRSLRAASRCGEHNVSRMKFMRTYTRIAQAFSDHEALVYIWVGARPAFALLRREKQATSRVGELPLRTICSSTRLRLSLPHTRHSCSWSLLVGLHPLAGLLRVSLSFRGRLRSSRFSQISGVPIDYPQVPLFSFLSDTKK